MMEKASLYIMRDTDGVKGYFPSSTERAVIGTYTYDAQRMGGAPTITATLTYPRCLDKEWTKKEYVEFNGERYYIRKIPSSAKDNTDTRYKHELTFVSERAVLENVYFLDVVTNDTEDQYKDRYRSNTSKVHFYGDVHELAARINDSLRYSGLYDSDTGEGYHVEVDDGITSEAKDVDIEDKYIAEALQEIYNIFELPYYWTGKTCHIGDTESTLTEALEYGEDAELLSVSKDNANYKIINRITGHGGASNLPYYYPNKDAEGTAVYTVTNAESSLVENISLSKVMSYNASPYTKYELYWVDTDKARVETGSPLYVNGQETSWENVRTLTVEGGKASLASRIFRYKTYGLKGCRLTYPMPHQIIGINKTGGDGKETHSVNIFIGEWKGGNTPPNQSDNQSENNEYTFLSDGWYEVALSVDVRYENGSTPLTLELTMFGDIYYEYELGGHYFKYGDGKSIAYEDSGISLKMDGYVPQTTYNPEYANGEWTLIKTSETTPLTVNITGRNWIAPSQYLMPSVYRESGGAERYYNAENDTYDDGKGGKYTFKNTYDKSDPREGITNFEEIVPTIKGITNSKGQLFGEIADIAFDTDDSDAFKKGSDSEYLHSYFYVKLHIFDGDDGFNLFEHALENEDTAIEMTSGNCAACRFAIGVDKYAEADGRSYRFYNPVMTDDSGNLRKVNSSGATPYDGDYILPTRNKDSYVQRQQDTSRYEVWVAVKKETDTFGIIMPNASQGYRPAKGDTFVITGISLPEGYITNAEKRLDAALIADMKANNEERFTFSVRLSRIFLAENEAFASKLNENSRLTVRYDGVDFSLYVNNYTCKAGEDILYEVSVDLTDTLAVAQSGLQDRLDAVKAEILGSLPSSRDNTLTNGAKHFLRKDIPDTAQGLITFVNGLISKVKAMFDDGAEFGETVDSLIAGKGTLVTGDGRVQTDRLEVRGALTVLRLVVNEILGMQGDASFTETGMIEAVEDLGEDTYRLRIERRTAFEALMFREGNILYSIVNDLPTGGTSYYTSWMRVVAVNTTENTVTVVLYADGEVPGGVNYAPQAGYYVTRRGDARVPEGGGVNEDAQSWLISSREGRMMFLANVYKPVLEDWNYALVLGKLPKLAALEQIPVKEGDVGLMADVVVARQFYRFDGNGNVVTDTPDRGEWSLAVAEGEAPYRYVTHEMENPSTGYAYTVLEQHTVWHLGCKWGCLVDKTVKEPKWNSTDWVMLEGDPNYVVTIESTTGSLFRRSAVRTDLAAVVWYGSIDITDDVLATAGTEVEWLRDTGRPGDDAKWTADYVDGRLTTIRIDNSDGHGVGADFGYEYREVKFTCRVFVPVGGSQAEKMMLEGEIEVR